MRARLIRALCGIILNHSHLISMRRNTFKPIIFITLILGLVAIVFLFVYHSVPSQRLASPPPDFNVSQETEGYAVYSALLKELFIKDDVKLLLIQKQTISAANHPLISATYEVPISDVKKHFPSVSEDTFQDYMSKNGQSSTLSSKFNLPVEYVVIDEVEPKKGKDSELLASLYEKHPNARGIIRLSKVGFNKDRTEAFVFIEFRCEPFCGRGDNVLLEKPVGVWKVKEVFVGWKS